jgi:hypothetical protein
MSLQIARTSSLRLYSSQGCGHDSPQIGIWEASKRLSGRMTRYSEKATLQAPRERGMGSVHQVPSLLSNSPLYALGSENQTGWTERFRCPNFELT